MTIPDKGDILTLYHRGEPVLTGVVKCCALNRDDWDNGVDEYMVSFSKIIDGENWKRMYNMKEYSPEYYFYTDDKIDVIPKELYNTKMGELLYG